MITNLAGAVVDAVASIGVVIPVRCQVVCRVDRPGVLLSGLILLPLILGKELCLLLVRPICRCARPPRILHSMSNLGQCESHTCTDCMVCGHWV
jgi:hypothetical protein